MRKKLDNICRHSKSARRARRIATIKKVIPNPQKIPNIGAG